MKPPQEPIKRKRQEAFATMTYGQYVRKFLAICKARGFTPQILGRIGPEKFPFYSLILNPNLRGDYRSLVMCAGIHGDEESGPLSVLDFLKDYNPRTFPRVKIIIFPNANPTGFDRHIRMNHDDYDLNRTFFMKNPPRETQCMIEMLQHEIQRKRPTFSLAVHEDNAWETYFHTYNRKYEKGYRYLLKKQEKFFPILKTPRRYNVALEDGLSFDFHDTSFDDWISHHKVPYCMTLETPTLYPMRRLIEANAFFLKEVISFVSRTK